MRTLIISLLLCGAMGCSTEAEPTPLNDVTADGRPADVNTPPEDDAGATAVPIETSHGLPVIGVEVNPELLDEMHENYDDDITALVSVTMSGKRWYDVKFELHGGHARTLPKKTGVVSAYVENADGNWGRR